MFYFSINSPDNCHLGFLVLMDEDNSAYTDGATGYYAVKAQADETDQQACPVQWQILQQLSVQDSLRWFRKADYVQLCDAENNIIGRLQQQYLILCGQHFILNDLTGTL
ncbi:hypothetical protein BGI05_05555 [Snodgrassella alvi]|uniref:HLGFF motif protein n=1 Tax=Snodgrassella TaxID=1193515 RepID=UPI000A021069|nr:MULTISPECIES: hypothetical protein [Snodgrassella]NUF08357.1 hypothetical protein [Snodgrassella sp. ESL0324]ORE99977.1 hypothetical protein BGH97_09510 [Snodgrassella alvi]ORF06775.1 hypothetical protein BGH99_11480 [Snodgrassella alvi]ORF10070.1 hypothetical protein BGI00_10880 [Snodgrassella alvi]ORF11335.1 hypothetical protein BGI02_10835 [Snodgrassella alvi]